MTDVMPVLASMPDEWLWLAGSLVALPLLLGLWDWVIHRG